MAGTFQSIVMIVATVILLICLVIIGVMLYRSKYNMQFPPVVADCPDYWLDMSDGDSRNCVNAKDLGSCGTKQMDFSSSFWTGPQGDCRKFQWARGCDLTWDGITNAENPCASASS